MGSGQGVADGDGDGWGDELRGGGVASEGVGASHTVTDRTGAGPEGAAVRTGDTVRRELGAGGTRRTAHASPAAAYATPPPLHGGTSCFPNSMNVDPTSSTMLTTAGKP